MEEKDSIKETDSIKENNDIKDENTHVGPEILRGFNFDKRDKNKKSSQPGQGLLILLIILGAFLISLGSYLLIEMPSGNVTGADRVQAIVFITIVLAAGAFVTVIPALRLAHGRFRGGSHENG